MNERIAMPVLFPASASSSSCLATFLQISPQIWELFEADLTKCHPSVRWELPAAASCRDWLSRSTWEHFRYLCHLSRDRGRCSEWSCHCHHKHQNNINLVSSLLTSVGKTCTPLQRRSFWTSSPSKERDECWSWDIPKSRCRAPHTNIRHQNQKPSHFTSLDIILLGHIPRGQISDSVHRNYPDVLYCSQQILGNK